MKSIGLIVLALVGVLTLALVVQSCASTSPNRNPTGEVFPSVQGKSLKSVETQLPQAYEGKVSVFLVGYVMESQFDIDRWLIGLSQLATPVTLVEVPTIEGMLPGLFAGKIDSGMRKGIPMEDWASVITLYNSEAARVVQFTGNESPRNARVLLLNGNGRVVWYHDRGFSPGVLNDLHRIVVDSNTNKSKSTTDAVSLRVLFNFESKSAFEGWRTINDSVMGGISDSTFEQYDSNSALFTGEVSLENNGGFASVRSGNQVFNLGDVRGLEVEIIGDGKLYQCNMRMDGAFDGIGYQTTFPTQAGKRETIRLAFEAFQPTFRGRLQPNAPTLDPEKIVNVGFLVGSKQQGPFRLQIFRVSALD